MKNKLILILCALIAVNVTWAAEGGKDGDGEGGNALWSVNDPYYAPTITFRDLVPGRIEKEYLTLSTLFMAVPYKQCQDESVQIIAENLFNAYKILLEKQKVYLYRAYYTNVETPEGQSIKKRCVYGESKVVGSLPQSEYLQLLQNQSAMIASRANLLLSQLDQLFAKYSDPLQLEHFQKGYLDLNQGLVFDFNLNERKGSGTAIQLLAEQINTLKATPAVQMSGGAEILSQVNTGKLLAYYEHYDFKLHIYLDRYTNFSQIEKLHQQSFRYLNGSTEWLAIRNQIVALWQPRYYSYAVAFKSKDPNVTIRVSQLIFEMIERYNIPKAK